MDGADVVTPGPTSPPDPLYIHKNTQQSKFLLSQTFKWKKIMFFVIPEMPSKTFVVLKKNFLITLRTVVLKKKHLVNDVRKSFQLYFV